MTKTHHFKNGQQGAVLIVSMIILLLLTILGVTSMRNTNLEERMAGNARDRHIAFEAAEAALVDAEDFLSTVATTGAFDTTGNDGLYNDDDTFGQIETYVDWSGTDPTRGYITATNIGTSHGVATAPKYVIQFISSFGTDTDRINLDNYGQGTGGGKTGLFRITARGTGASDNSIIYLQTVFGVSGL